MCCPLGPFSIHVSFFLLTRIMYAILAISTLLDPTYCAQPTMSKPSSWVPRTNCAEIKISFVSTKHRLQFSSVQSVADWVVGRTRGTIQQRSSSSRFCRRPLWAVLAWAGIATLWCCPCSISFADSVGTHQHSPRYLEWWFWRVCRGVIHVRTMQVSCSRQLPEEISVDPQGSWSCSAPSRSSSMEYNRILLSVFHQ